MQKSRVSVWSLIYPILIYYGVTTLVQSVFIAIIMLRDIGLSGLGDISSFSQFYSQNITEITRELLAYSNIMTIIAGAIIIPLMLLFITRDKKRKYREGTYVTYDKVSAIYYIVIVLLGGMAALTANNLVSISGISNIDSVYNTLSELSLFNGNIIIEVLATVIIGPIIEELIFRGLVFARMREGSKFIPAMIVSSLVFALVHGNLTQGVYAFLIGLLLALVYEKTHSVIACIAFHAGANGFCVLLQETGFVKFISQDSTWTIVYIVATAVFTIALLWVVYEKMEVGVLIPASCDSEKEVEE